MENSKQQYLESIRSNSAYPVYRNFIGILASIGRIIAGLDAVITLFKSLGAMKYSFPEGVGIFIIGGVGAVLIYFLAIFFKEAALILADIGDSTLEANSRSAATK